MNRLTLKSFDIYEDISQPVPAGQKRIRKYVELEKQRNRRAVQTVENLVERALLILETKDGKKALVTHAENVVNALIKEKQPHLYPRNDLKTFSKMPGYIDKFLESLWKNFPDVKIENDGREDAAFVRDYWAPKAAGTTLETCSSGFVASQSGEMYLTLASKNEENILKWKFHMIVAIVHELGHCLTGYLSGDPNALTSKQVGVKGKTPEAGYALELLLFKNILEMWATPNQPPNQPGVPYAFEDLLKDTKGQRISMKYIKDFIEGTSGML
ncbi:hypothetical protein C8A01DRAFT_18527 [Parachaetomium inaequale]|uniref:Uncharacterized protein n=1 Tax=Parachaetomium inaequale TaxID=2588326 RepID=A0AAN6PC23_9PEZI|nr:hypothetical protein C8A01DRAFT_18527 [Parachaetomium inaequale]